LYILAPFPRTSEPGNRKKRALQNDVTDLPMVGLAGKDGPRADHKTATWTYEGKRRASSPIHGSLLMQHTIGL